MNPSFRPLQPPQTRIWFHLNPRAAIVVNGHIARVCREPCWKTEPLGGARRRVGCGELRHDSSRPPEGSLPFIWWLCWPATGTYGAARVASSASTRCRWKAACHILPPHRHRSDGWVGVGRDKGWTPIPRKPPPFKVGGAIRNRPPSQASFRPVLRLSETGWEVLLAGDHGAPPLEGGPCGHPPSLAVEERRALE